MINSWPGRGQEAIGLLRRAAKADTSFILVYSNLGFTYAEMNKHDSAIIMYNECIRRMPNSAYAYSNRSYSKLKIGDLKGWKLFAEAQIGNDKGIQQHQDCQEIDHPMLKSRIHSGV